MGEERRVEGEFSVCSISADLRAASSHLMKQLLNALVDLLGALN